MDMNGRVGGRSVTMMWARDFAARWWDAATAVPGVYAVLADRANGLLRRCRYLDFCETPPPRIQGRLLLNIGSTSRMDLGRRLNHHLWGDSRRSSLRRTLAVLWSPCWVLPHGEPGMPSFHLGDRGEDWATDFLLSHAHFAWWPSEEPAHEEAALIAEHTPITNLKGLERLPWTQRVLGLRRSWADAAQV